MLRSTIALSLAILAGLAQTSDLNAQRGKGGNKEPAALVQRTAEFTVVERQIFVEFFATHRQEVEGLPPGIARNLARGKSLPPGIAKRQIPSQLRAQLPDRVGVEVTIFGDRIVLLEAGGIVVDILEGIFT